MIALIFKAPPAQRPGFSLLEVLVACGVLVVGLASIAAIMPAAGARLGEAAAHDRAGAVIANAFAEIHARNLVSPRLFQTGTSASGAPLYSGTCAVMFGEGTTLLPAVPNTFVVSNGAGASVLSGTWASGWLASRIDMTGSRGFFLEDDLQFLPSTEDAPYNSFVDGVREFRRGVCWAAMITPSPWITLPAGAITLPADMKIAKVSVLAFQKPPTEVLDMQVVQNAGNVYEVTSAALFDGVNSTPVALNQDFEDFRRTFLRPCAHVLAVPLTTGTVAPAWLGLGSTWITEIENPPGNIVYVPQVSFSGNPTLSGTARIIGFEHLINVTEELVKVR
jgi:type II secretory pathway pseudopilin PulG